VVNRETAMRILTRLRAAGHVAYFAGGCVRDMLLGVEPEDYDIATSATPEEVMKLFPQAISVGAKFGVVTVPEGGAHYEIATFRADGPPLNGRRPASVRFCDARGDVRRRDFTINGMLYDPITGEVLDWVGGQEDLKRRVVRTIGRPHERFLEDRLRMVRAVRFAARLEFAIEEKTYEAIRQLAPEVRAVSAERLRDELLRILTTRHAGRGLRLLHDTGLLRHILPEVEALVGVDQPPDFHPEGDVFEHTCRMLDLANEPSPELALGILLHDVGKPQTQRVMERIRFDDHDAVGAEMAREICARLRCSRAQSEQVVALVGQHMRLMHAREMKESTLRRLLALPRFEEHLELHRLDCLASHGKLDNWQFLIAARERFVHEKPVPSPLLTGHDLIALGLTPGPLFGKILRDVQEQQLERRLNSRQEALDYVRRQYLAPGATGAGP